jgi:transmembrane sensor
MNNDYDWNLLVRFVTDECSIQEEEKVKEWMQSNSDIRDSVHFLEKIWKSSKSLSREVDTEKALNEVKESAMFDSEIIQLNSEKNPLSVAKSNKDSYTRRSSLIVRCLSVAAVLILITSGSYYFTKSVRENSSSPVQQVYGMEEIVVDYEKQAKLTLDDGSKVTLDAGSVFSYPQRFSGDTREVSLQGEGYFEVVPDPQKPFIVRTNDAIIWVLGTKFNIRAWLQSQEVKVVVSEGKVTLRAKTDVDEEAVLISKGQLSILRKNTKPTIPHEIDLVQHLAWLNYEVIFDDAPMKEVLYQLERWYGLRFFLPDNSIASDLLTIHVKNRPIEDIVETIALILDLQYERTGRTIVFFRKT